MDLSQGMSRRNTGRLVENRYDQDLLYSKDAPSHVWSLVTSAQCGQEVGSVLFDFRASPSLGYYGGSFDL